MPVHVDPSVTKLAEFLTATEPLSPSTQLHTEPTVLAPPLCIGDLRAALALRTDAEGLEPAFTLSEEELSAIDQRVVIGQVGSQVVTAGGLLRALRGSIQRRGILAMALEECLELSWEADGPEGDEEGRHPMTRLEDLALTALARVVDDLSGTSLEERIQHLRERRKESLREWRRAVAAGLGWKPEEEGDSLTPKLAQESIAAVVDAAGQASELSQRLTTTQAALDHTRETLVRECSKNLRAFAALEKLGLPDLSAADFDAKVEKAVQALKNGWLAQKNLASTAAREGSFIAALDAAGVPSGVPRPGYPGMRSHFPDDRVRWLASRFLEQTEALNRVGDAALLLTPALQEVATSGYAEAFEHATGVTLEVSLRYPSGEERTARVPLPATWPSEAVSAWRQAGVALSGEVPMPLPLRPLSTGEVTEKVACRVCRKRSVFTAHTVARLVLGVADQLHEGVRPDAKGLTGWRFLVASFEAQLRLLSAHLAYAVAGVCSSCVEKVDPELAALHESPPELHGAALARWRKLAPHDFQPGTMLSVDEVREAIIDTAQATVVSDRQGGALEVGERLGMKVVVPPLESGASSAGTSCGCPILMVAGGHHLPTCKVPMLVSPAELLVKKAELDAKLDELTAALVGAGRVVPLRTAEAWTAEQRAEALAWARSRTGGIASEARPVPAHVRDLPPTNGRFVCTRAHPWAFERSPGSRVTRTDARLAIHPDEVMEENPSGETVGITCPWCRSYREAEVPK